MKPLDPEQLQAHVGRRVAALRVERGLTQEGFAASIDAAARYVQYIEAGRQNITLRTIARLATGLQVPPEELLRGFGARRSR